MENSRSEGAASLLFYTYFPALIFIFRGESLAPWCKVADTTANIDVWARGVAWWHRATKIKGRTPSSVWIEFYLLIVEKSDLKHMSDTANTHNTLPVLILLFSVF